MNIKYFGILSAAVLFIGLWLTPLAVTKAAKPTTDDQETFFETNVRPLLWEQCEQCHGAKKQESGFRVDAKHFLLAGGDSGPAIIPGDAEQSLLIRAVRRLDGLEMPPQHPLADHQIEVLKAWIDLGADWPLDDKTADDKPIESQVVDAGLHWAFQPIIAPPVPDLESGMWAETPIDAFIEVELRKQQLGPAEPADRRTLMRRLSHALTGLPPTTDRLQEFVDDRSPDAYERLVEELLESPRYGEKWGRHWLDTARYSDTKGYVYAREERFWTQAWTYRDWVVDALNDDLPYDKFLMLQIAADQMNDRRPGDLAAMGFLTLGRRFLGVSRDIIDDRIDVVTRGTMGLTVSCARCHDHKYDAIPTADYYSLYGVFDSSVEKQVVLDLSNSDESYREELKKRQMVAKERIEELSTAASDRARQRLADYLLAQTELEKYPADGFDQIFETTDLLPAFVRRWQRYLRDANLRQDPIFTLWHAYANLPTDDFATMAVDVRQALLNTGVPISPQIQSAFVEPPSSMREVCDRYAETLLAEDNRGAFEEILFGPDSPCLIPEGSVSNIETFFNTSTIDELWKLQGEIDRWLINAAQPVPVAVTLADRAVPIEPRIFRRGDPLKLGEDVPRQFLQVLCPDDRQPFRQGSGRLELARAITAPTNPLTARVIVNRIWAEYFGTGIVDTPSDFGVRAEKPIHLNLLNWLAARFIDEGWSLKRLHRQIVLSKTFRQSSAPPADPALREHAIATDPDARLLWRMPPRRLSFEELRDTMLYVGGQLDLTPGGPATDLFSKPDHRRRTLYGRVDRQYFPAALRIFDFANPDLHIPQRSETTVPQQALFFLNDPFVLQRAKALAKIAREEPTTTAGVQTLFEVVYQRDAEQFELQAALNIINSEPPQSGEAIRETAEQWSYGYGSLDETKHRTASFIALPHFTGDAWQGGESLPDGALGWVQISASGGHPGNDLQHAAIRRWTAPENLTVKITSNIAHLPEVSDGIRCTIVSSRDGLLKSLPVHHQEIEFNLTDIHVQKGDTLDFVVDINEELNSDQFTWQIDIDSIQESSWSWNSAADFTSRKTETLDAWERLAQVLLCSNEFFFVD